MGNDHSPNTWVANCCQTAADGDNATIDSLHKLVDGLSNGTIANPLWTPALPELVVTTRPFKKNCMSRGSTVGDPSLQLGFLYLYGFGAQHTYMHCTLLSRQVACPSVVVAVTWGIVIIIIGLVMSTLITRKISLESSHFGVPTSAFYSQRATSQVLSHIWLGWLFNAKKTATRLTRTKI